MTKRLDIDKETHWYIIKFLAHKVAFQDFVNNKSYDKTYSVYKNQLFNSLDDISSALSIEYEKLKSLNRWITSNEIPNDKEYSFLIPVDIEYLNQKISSFDVDKVKDFIESKLVHQST